MNRADLQRLSRLRIEEARSLLKQRHYSGAYYLAGYAIECALKACFAKGVQRYDFPDKGRADKIFTHVLTEIVSLSGLKTELEADLRTKPGFAACWGEVIKWSEASRYTIKTRFEAEAIIDAILRRKDGVLPWIKQRW